MQEKKNKDYSKRIEALTQYLSQGLYGQEETIKNILLFTSAERKSGISCEDTVLKKTICHRVAAAFKEFYSDNNFSIKTKGQVIESLNIPKIPIEKFFDFATYDLSLQLIPTEEQKSLLFTIEEVDKLQAEIQKIALSAGVKAYILRYRHNFEDSYWQDLVHVLQTSAFLNGRDTVCLADCMAFNNLSGSIGIQDHLFRDDYKNDYVKDVDIPKLVKEFHDFIHKNCSTAEKESSSLKTIKKWLNTNYSSITKKIDDSLVQLQKFRTELEEDNIFKVNSRKDWYDEFFDETIKYLKETKEDLKKKYEEIKFSFVKEIEIGDLISTSGDLLKSIRWGNGDNVFAVIAIKGNTADSIYGISQEGWQEKSYKEAEEIAAAYKGKNSPVYKDAWKIPDIEQLEQIYQNRQIIEPDGGYKLGYKLTGKFWSSTKKDNDAVYFFDFDKGIKDYTTTDHKYNLALVYKFGE